MKKLLLFIAAIIFFASAIWWRENNLVPRFRSLPLTIVARRVPTSGVAAQIVRGAKSQYGTRYDASFQTIDFPNGDVSSTRGACSDVVVRALRSANFDLQKLMHEDMTRNFRLYPNKWGLSAPNTNIDHRRVPNQMTFFARYGKTLPITFTSSTRSSWQPGDIVIWNSGGGRTHTGIVSDGVSPLDVPLIIHNNQICREEDVLFRWKIIGHFRFPK
jgi:hypothetical protein